MNKYEIRGFLKSNDWFNEKNDLVTLLLSEMSLLSKSGGHSNGYAIIDSTHPCYKKHYDDINVHVHGGLTFGQLIVQEMIDDEHWGKHINQDDLNKYIVGFDTLHYNDNGQNCNEAYCLNELTNLISQLEYYGINNA